MEATVESESVIRFWVAKKAYAGMAGPSIKGSEISAIEGDTVVIGDVRIQTAKYGSRYIVGWTT